MEKEEEILLFPIHFKSKIEKKIFIEKDLRIRRITEKETKDFFGIKVTERNENGFVIFSVGKGFSFDSPFASRYLNYEIFIISSQFILESKNVKKVEYFQQTLKLYKDGKTGISFGINPKTKGIRFFYPIPFYGKEIYSLDEDDIPKIKELFNEIKKTKNDKFNLMIEKFLFALSGEGIKNEHRFLELVTILEMLYLGKDRGEQTFKFSLRGAKVLSKYLSLDSKEVYDNMRKIYEIRSSISHSGFHKDISNYLDSLIYYTRQSIRLFLKDVSIFSKENLDKLCVKNWKD